MGWSGGFDGNFPVFTVGAVLANNLVTVTLFLDVTISVIRAARTITVPSLVVTVTISVSAVILAWRIVTTSAATGRRRRSATTTRRTTTWCTLAVSARIESPGSRRRSSGPLDLQDIISSEALVVHFVVCIVCVTSVLIFNKSEPKTTCSSSRCRNVAADKAAIAVIYPVRILFSNEGVRMDEEGKG
jgi:hypothetical protein